MKMEVGHFDVADSRRVCRCIPVANFALDKTLVLLTSRVIGTASKLV